MLTCNFRQTMFIIPMDLNSDCKDLWLSVQLSSFQKVSKRLKEEMK